MEEVVMAEKTNANIGFEKQLWDGDIFQQQNTEK